MSWSGEGSTIIGTKFFYHGVQMAMLMHPDNMAGAVPFDHYFEDIFSIFNDIHHEMLVQFLESISYL